MRKFLLIITVSFITTIYAQESTFDSLGFIDDATGAFSQAEGVSEDGTVVTGMSYSLINGSTAVAQAFRWENGVMEGIGMVPTSPETTPWSYARSISADGSTIVGYSHTDESFEMGWEAMRWTEDGGMQPLGDFSPSDYWSESTDVSADGNIVVGRSYMTGQAFRWENGVMENLSTDEVHFLEAWGISYDGSVIAGNGIIDGVQQGVIWRTGENIIGTGSPVGGTTSILNLSANGNYAVGDVYISGISNSAMRWSEEEGALEIGTLGGFTAQGLGVSNDGVVVGFSQAFEDPEYYAFIFTEENGMQNLQEVLQNNYGLDLTGWKLSVATAITSDGKTIVGYGVNPDGKTEAWRVVLGEPTVGECTAPEGFSIGNITGTTAEFSWDSAEGETNGYNWYVMNVGDFPETGTPVDSGTTNPGINFATASGLTPNTIYFVYLQTNCSDGAQSEYGLFIITTSDLGITEFENQFTLYPNPTTGIFQIQTQEKIRSISVYNTIGQKVSFNSLNQENTSIDISNLTSGTYFVEIILNDKTIKRHKVIKK